MTRIEEIAGKLTKAQREAMLSHDNWMQDDLARTKPRLSASLHRLHLTYVELSPLGLAVRAHLERTSHDPD